MALALAFPALAQAESCTYNPATASVSAAITPGGSAVLDVVGGEIRFGAVADAVWRGDDDEHQLDLNRRECGNERATDARPAHRSPGPGAAAESNIPEIEMTLALGDATDTVVVYGTRQ